MLVFTGEACSKGRSHLINPKKYTVGSSILAIPDSKALPDSSQVKPAVPDSQFGNFRIFQIISESVAGTHGPACQRG